MGGPDSSGGKGAGSSGAPCVSGSDAGVTGPWWPYTNEHGCLSTGVPSKDDVPTCEDPGPSLPPIYMALTRFRLGTAKDDKFLTPDREAWKDIGFDFDKRCTKSITCEDSSQVLINETACKDLGVLVPNDGNNCRDNEIGNLFNIASSSPSIGKWFGMTEADWNCEMHRGGLGTMLKVSNYNGKKNDQAVRLDVYTSLGLRDLNDVPWRCRTSIEADLDTQWADRGSWLPNEPWRIAKSSIAFDAVDSGSELPNSKYFDSAAFVRNGYLFARLPEGTDLWLNGKYTAVPGFRLIVHRGLLTGELIKDQSDLWTIDHGLISGVVNAGEMLKTFREIGLCENLCGTFDQVKDYLNVHKDAIQSTDRILPDTPCDSLTFAHDFESRQASTSADLVEQDEPWIECPQPKHPEAPRQGCVCSPTGGGCPRDGG